MKWQVQITGDNTDLEELTSIFKSPELRITRKDDAYLLESSSFDPCLDDTAVKPELDRVLSFVNGVKLLKLHSSKPITRDAIISQNDQGRKTIHIEMEVSVCASAHIQVMAIRKDGSIEEFVPENHESKWLPLMKTDNRVQRVFEIVTHNFNSYIELYKIIEIIREDEFTPVLRSGGFYEEINRFKETAESYDAIGKDARHAHSKFKKPTNPMTLDQAIELVKKILYLWLDSKVAY